MLVLWGNTPNVIGADSDPNSSFFAPPNQPCVAEDFKASNHPNCWIQQKWSKCSIHRYQKPIFKTISNTLPFFWSNKLIINAYLKGGTSNFAWAKDIGFCLFESFAVPSDFRWTKRSQRCLSCGVDTTPTKELPWKHRICVKPSTRRMHHHHHHHHHRHRHRHHNHHQIKVSLYHWHSFKWTERSVW